MLMLKWKGISSNIPLSQLGVNGLVHPNTAYFPFFSD